MHSFLTGLFLFLPTITGMALFYGGGPSEFLRMVNPNAMQQFYEICQIANQSKSDVLSQLQSWAQANGVSSQFANVTAALVQRQQDLQSLANGNLAGQALQYFNQIYNLLTNNAITRLVECQTLHNMTAMNLVNSSSLQREIYRLVPVPPASIPCPYPRQCYRNVFPFSMPMSRDEAVPAEVVNVEFIRVPENMRPSSFQGEANGAEASK